MLETACPDAKFTRKSAMYRAVADAVKHDDTKTCLGPDSVEKLFRYIPGLAMADTDEVLEALGKGWAEGEEYLRGRLRG